MLVDHFEVLVERVLIHVDRPTSGPMPVCSVGFDARYPVLIAGCDIDVVTGYSLLASQRKTSVID